VACAALLWLAEDVSAAPCASPAARLVSVEGQVERQPAGAAARGAGLPAQGLWEPAALNAPLCHGEFVRVGQRSRAAIRILQTGVVVRISEQSVLRIPEAPSPSLSLIELLRGAVLFLTGAPRTLHVRTPFVNAAVEGTEFVVQVGDDQTLVAVLEGRVALENPVGRLTLTGDQAAVTRAGQPPQLTVGLRPRDAVRWAVYYEPVRPLRSFEALAQVPGVQQDATFFVDRAAALLSVGRVEEAEADVNRAIAMAPDSGEPHALGAIIALARNAREAALTSARRAVEAAPDSGAASVALSYALQAAFDLEGARRTLLRAVSREPGNALAWARLSELHLSLGDVSQAVNAASRAASLAPGESRAAIVQGFAALAETRPRDAAAAFERAVALESGNPLARLGLGLAMIRLGRLDEGREELALAALLDPDDALIRSYLGKAYFEERRHHAAAAEFATAKRLDPNDPTPWLYDAIRQQSDGRPIEAMQSVQRSIELNENRAVFRSRQMLDEDQAVRSASLGRIFRDLGFEQLALVQGWDAIARDPANHSGHRLLADSYSVLPRHEIARDSELLQALLLQPANHGPVDPRLSADGLFNEMLGPSAIGVSEFTRVFAANGMRLYLDGVAGSQDTLLGNVAHTGIYDRLSYSVGYSAFDTDGFRANHDLGQRFGNAFVQAELGYRTGVQVELRGTDERSGDRRLLFDPANFQPAERRDTNAFSGRAGLRHRFNPGSIVIAGYTAARADGTLDIESELNIDTDETAGLFEAQHIFRSPRLATIAGYGRFRGTTDETVAFGPFPPDRTVTDVEHDNAYGYLTVSAGPAAALTFGLSADRFNDVFADTTQVNPKVGFAWKPARPLALRAAAFRALKRTLIGSQTVEPTQVAGFNQFFDDAPGTDAWRYGAGIDVSALRGGAGTPDVPTLLAGAEVSRRDLDVPIGFLAGPRAAVTVDHQETVLRSYAYWTPDPSVAVTAEYFLERLVRDDAAMNPEGLGKSTAHRVPIQVGFYHPRGWSLKARAIFARQRGRFLAPASTDLVEGRSSFALLDLSAGYRFPGRWGLATLEVLNLFDADVTFQESEPTRSRLSRRRAVFAGLKLPIW
jgi:tetratricopeptide (TPR) repeat protein